MRRWIGVGLGLWGLAVLLSGRSCAADAPTRVIVMIGDGCGYGQREALSLYRYGRPGAAAWDALPLQLAMSTYPAGGSYEPDKYWASIADAVKGPTDSAAAATAMATGVKTKNGAIGVDPEGQPVRNVVEAAEARGMATGVVTTVTWSHATPAGFVAHQSSRSSYVEIAKEMVNDSAVDVIMGAGHPYRDSNGQPREEGKFDSVGGQETWDALVAGRAGGDADGDGQPDAFTLLTRPEDVRKLADGRPPKRVLVTFETSSTLQYGRKQASDEPFVDPWIANVPTLAEMSIGALQVLNQDPDGLFLMIEGGAIDSASHGNKAGRTVEEAAGFEDAVQAVSDWVEAHGGWDHTLLIITADHETGMLTGPDEDGLFAPLTVSAKGQLPGLAWHGKGHSNSLVPFSAKGLGADWYAKAADRTDPRRGKYLDNTSLAKGVFELLAR